MKENRGEITMKEDMGSEDGGDGELALPAAEPTMRPRIYPRIFLRYSSAGKWPE